MAEIVIRFGGYQSPQSIHSQAAVVFGEYLEKQAGQDLRFELHGNITSSGRNASDLLHLVESGELTICYFSASYLASRIPEFGLLDLPFMIRDRDHAYEILDGPLGAMLSEKLAENTGYKLLAFWDNGFRHFSNSRRPIHSPDDCKDIRLRILFNDLHEETFRRLGFDPVRLDVKDLVPAVIDKRVDAQENPLTNTYNFGIHRHHRYITMSSHFFGAALLLCHRESFNRWPRNVQDSVMEAVHVATGTQRRLAEQEDEIVLTKLDPDQNEVAGFSETERLLFVERLKPLIDTQRDRFGDTLFQLVAS